jgi:hypothetical protein
MCRGLKLLKLFEIIVQWYSIHSFMLPLIIDISLSLSFCLFLFLFYLTLCSLVYSILLASFLICIPLCSSLLLFTPLYTLYSTFLSLSLTGSFFVIIQSTSVNIVGFFLKVSLTGSILVHCLMTVGVASRAIFQAATFRYFYNHLFA